MPGTWQYTRLRDNLKALRHAFALIDKDTTSTDDFTRDDRQEALRAFSSMISRAEKAQAKFLPGASQYTLLQNRLEALRVAEALIKMEPDKG